MSSLFGRLSSYYTEEMFSAWSEILHCEELGHASKFFNSTLLYHALLC